MSKRCSNCGHENRDVAIFCGNCGSRLIATNLTSNFRDTGSTNGPSTNGTNTNTDGTSTTSTTTNGSSTTTSTNANGSGDIFSLCCGVLIILFVIMLIMSMG